MYLICWWNEACNGGIAMEMTLLGNKRSAEWLRKCHRILLRRFHLPLLYTDQSLAGWWMIVITGGNNNESGRRVRRSAVGLSGQVNRDDKHPLQRQFTHACRFRGASRFRFTTCHLCAISSDTKYKNCVWFSTPSPAVAVETVCGERENYSITVKGGLFLTLRQQTDQ